ncbi:MAG TPA: hypothetical protein VF838_16920 [Trebonia sp.]
MSQWSRRMLERRHQIAARSRQWRLAEPQAALRVRRKTGQEASRQTGMTQREPPR